MKLLLDSCSFLWIILDAEKLSCHAKSLFNNQENEIFLSTVSVWEILVKCRVGKLDLPKPSGSFIIEQRKLHRIEALPLEDEAVIQLSQLPNYHQDPFDRMLVCQAIAHGLTILTPDKHILQYPVSTTW